TVPEIPGLERVGYLTSDDALELTEMPRSLLVLGGGVIACELGQYFSRMGAAVTLLQRSRQILSAEDPDVAMALRDAFANEGMVVEGGVTVVEVQAKGEKKAVLARIEGRERVFEADEILVCTGRHPAVAGLGLERAGVCHEASRIPVDAHLRTNLRHIYAAGDAMGRHQIVHQAIREAELAAHNAISSLSSSRSGTPGEFLESLDDRLVPQVVFTDPQVGRVGITERQAAQQGREVLVGKYPFADHGKALCLGRTEGFVKMLADPGTGEILGAAVVGPEGGELLHEMVVAMHFRCTAREFLRIPHVHPTLAEILTYPAEEIEEKRIRVATVS
ncbi:MAG: FAD-dependent oxidoreductase, partial [Cyanobacteria bacterium REEB65]|nr:FAD-dependent oxidoreductase [Cyanobacteria bacterium REEB65]